MITKSIVSGAIACSLFAAPKPRVVEPPVEPSASLQSRTVQYSEHDVIRIATRLRYTSLIILPKDEQIVEFLSGDKEFWPVKANGNLASVKPSGENRETSLNILTASGNVYSFVLTEGGPKSRPDLKVFIETNAVEMLNAMNGKPRYVPAQSVEDYQIQLSAARAEKEQIEKNATAEIAAIEEKARIDMAKARAALPGELKYTYDFGKDPVFAVVSISHNDKWTFIHSNSRETPTLYELKDGKPSLIEFQYVPGKNGEPGYYVVPKILDRGYLVIGKKKFHITRLDI